MNKKNIRIIVPIGILIGLVLLWILLYFYFSPYFFINFLLSLPLYIPILLIICICGGIAIYIVLCYKNNIKNKKEEKEEKERREKEEKEKKLREETRKILEDKRIIFLDKVYNKEDFSLEDAFDLYDTLPTEVLLSLHTKTIRKSITVCEVKNTIVYKKQSFEKLCYNYQQFFDHTYNDKELYKIKEILSMIILCVSGFKSYYGYQSLINILQSEKMIKLYEKLKITIDL